MSIVMIDNYDSFTYNLVQYLGELGAQVTTVRNDRCSVDDLAALKPKALVISPGPCTPTQAGISLAAIEYFQGKLPILGVCLGHQAIGMHFGAKLVPATRVMHGKTDVVSHDGKGVFTGLPERFEVVRYHSLAINDLPDSLLATARTDDGQIMGVRHRELPIEGVQFHPESIASEHGHRMLFTFLRGAGIEAALPAGIE